MQKVNSTPVKSSTMEQLLATVRLGKQLHGEGSGCPSRQDDHDLAMYPSYLGWRIKSSWKTIAV